MFEPRVLSGAIRKVSRLLSSVAAGSVLSQNRTLVNKGATARRAPINAEVC